MKRNSLLISVAVYLLMSPVFMPGSSSGSQEQAQKGCLIFLYDSQACQCVRERNDDFILVYNKESDLD